MILTKLVTNHETASSQKRVRLRVAQGVLGLLEHAITLPSPGGAHSSAQPGVASSALPPATRSDLVTPF